MRPRPLESGLKTKTNLQYTTRGRRLEVELEVELIVQLELEVELEAELELEVELPPGQAEMETA